MKTPQCLLVVALAFSSLTARADLQADKYAGMCSAAMNAFEGDRAMKGSLFALSLADNKARALSFAKLWEDQATASGRLANKEIFNAHVEAAYNACYAIGINPADYLAKQ